MTSERCLKDLPETGLFFQAEQSYSCPMPTKAHVYSHAVWRILAVGQEQFLIQTTTAAQIEPSPNKLIESRSGEATKKTRNDASKTKEKQ
jgi:hypothetical protein